MQNNREFVKLPESELRLMQALWTLEAQGDSAVTAAALMEADSYLGSLKLTTVLTLISRLQGRGFLSAEKKGRANCYTSLIAESDYRAQAAADFVATVCRRQPGSLLAALVDGGTLSEQEIAELRAMLDRVQKK
ncbi:MAG: BlaI/MecI/CopY family transcriptional regulator [Clostridia bacterium]|nr:BlaI/MecI/CopY family transcriptional regulator [Clostridia bacterium]